MSTRRPPPKSRFSEYVAPQVQTDSESLGKLMSLVQQGNFGQIYNDIGSMSVDVNAQIDGDVLINAIILVNPDQVSEERKLELIDYLVTHNQLYINTYGKNDITPIHIACKEGYELILDYLLKHQANVNAKTDTNMTPLHYATLISLKDCPDPRKPEPLLARKPQTDIKSDDITKMMVTKFLSDEETINVNLGESKRMITQFSQDMELLKTIYTEIVKSFIIDQLTDQKIVELTNSKMSQNEIIQRAYSTMKNDLKYLEFPDKLIQNETELDEIINHETLDGYILHNFGSYYISFYDELLTDVKKELKEHFEEKIKYIEKVISDKHQDFHSIFVRYNVRLNDSQMTSLLKRILCGVNVIDTYLPWLINHDYEHLKYPDGYTKEQETEVDTINFIRLIIPKAEWKDIVFRLGMDHFLDQIYQNYKSQGERDAPEHIQKNISLSFLQIAKHHNYSRINNHLVPFIKILHHNLNTILCALGRSFTDLNRVTIDKPNDDHIYTVENLYITDVRTNLSHRLVLAGIFYDIQPRDVRDLLDSRQSTLMMRTHIINKMFEQQVNGSRQIDFREVILSNDQNLLNGIVTCRERFLYKVYYPMTVSTFNFKNVPEIDTEDLNKSIIRQIAHIERLNIERYISMDDPIQDYTNNLKMEYESSMYHGLIHTVYDFTRGEVRQYVDPDTDINAGYLALEKEFTNIESVNVEAQDVVDAVSTFTSFVLTMHMRYFYDFNGKYFNGNALDNLPPIAGIVGPYQRTAGGNQPTVHALITRIRDSIITPSVHQVNDQIISNFEYILNNSVLFEPTFIDIKQYFSYFDNIFVNNNDGNPVVAGAGAPFQHSRMTLDDIAHISRSFDDNIGGNLAINNPIPVVPNEYVKIEDNYTLISAVILKSGINMIKRLHSNIDSAYLKSIIVQFMYDLEHDQGRIFGTYLNRSYVNSFRNHDQYKNDLFNPLQEAVRKSSMLNMQLYTFPFRGFKPRTLCTSFFRDITNPGIGAGGAREALLVLGHLVPIASHLINMNNTIDTIIDINIVHFISANKPEFDHVNKQEHVNTFMSLLIALNSLKLKANEDFDKPITEERVREFRNIFGLYKVIALYMSLYTIMLSTNIDNPGPTYLERMDALRRDMNNVDNPTNKINIAGGQQQASENISTTVNRLIDNKVAILNAMKNDINQISGEYNIESHNKLYALVRDLKRCYELNKVFEYVVRSQNTLMYNQVIHEIDSTASIVTVRRDTGGSSLYVDNMRIDSIPVPKYLENIDKISLFLPSTAKYLFLTYKTIIGFLNDNKSANPSVSIAMNVKIVNGRRFVNDPNRANLSIGANNNPIRNVFTRIHDQIVAFQALNDSDLNTLMEKLYVAMDDTITDSIVENVKYDINNNVMPLNINHNEHTTKDPTKAIYFYKGFNYNDIVYIVRSSYTNTVKRYTLSRLDDYDVNLQDGQKRAFLESHMQSIYEKFTVQYMRSFTDHLIKEFVKQKITTDIIDPDAIANFLKFNPQPSDLNVDLTKIDSKLTEFISGTAGVNMGSWGPDDLDVKLIEDEAYDIYVRTDNTVTVDGIERHVFHSFDYFSKQTTKTCLTINTNIIKRLIDAKAQLNIPDSNDMTPINYIIEGRMYYLLQGPDNKPIRDACKTPDSISTIIKYEQRHNALYFDDTQLFYKVRTYSMMLKFEKELIRKLRNSEAIKNNIPVNIKYVFWTFIVLQNIFWYRKMTYKARTDLTDYGSKFNEIYIERDDPGNMDSNIKVAYNWRELKSDVTVSKDSASKAIKYKSQVERSEEKSDVIDTKINTDRMNALSDDANKLEENVGVIGQYGDHDIEMFNYYKNVYLQFTKPVLYSSMWEELYNQYVHYKDGDDPNVYKTHPALIQHQLQKTYREALNGVIDESRAVLILDDYKISIDETKLQELIAKCQDLNVLYEPISQFIDDKFLPPVLNNNQLLLNQVRMFCHILSTYLGSHLLTYCRTIIYKEVQMYQGDNVDYGNIETITENLKTYVTTVEAEDGFLSYEFLKAHMHFKKSDEDDFTNEATNKLFISLTDKLTDLESVGLESRSKFIESLSSSMSNYYHTLYKETVNSLLEFSDSYYRFVKNQHLGIKCIASLQEAP